MFNIPRYVEKIIEKLESVGYETYIVGGSIRNILLGKEPSDYDIATAALPHTVEEIFFNCKTINIGKKFGTIIICCKEGNVEVTTFRKEGGYIDGRNPEWVSYSKNIIDDLSRRDFTINSMAYNKKTSIIDPYNGREDLKRKLIKTVGDPDKRFSEDYLRILRAIRFSSQLNFSIENKTFYAGKKHASKISNISMERTREELFKILISKTPSKGIRLLEKIGILQVILPELVSTIGFDQKNPHHELDLYNHILCVLDKTPSIIQIRLAALFHDLGKIYTLTVDEKGIGHFYGHDEASVEISEEILKRLKCSNELIEKVNILIGEHMNHHGEFKEKALKRLIRRVGEDEVFNLMALQKADIKCSNKEATVYHIIEREKNIKDVLEHKQAYEINQIDINGSDLITLGFDQGKKIGEILEYLLEKVMEEPELNKKENLKDMALEKFSRP